MSECKQIRELLALRSGDWSAAESQKVDTHLASCADCAARAGDYARQDRLIRSAPRVRLTTAQREQLFSRVRQERRHKVRNRISAALGTAGAVIALVALALGLYSMLSGSQGPTTSASGGPVATKIIATPSEAPGQPTSPTQATLRIFSGRPNPAWTLTPAQEAELQVRLTDLPATDQPFDDSGRLGYSGFFLQQLAQTIIVDRGLVQIEREGKIVGLWSNPDRSIELWLLETAAGHVEPEIAEAIRQELETTPPAPAALLGQFQWPAAQREISGWTFHDPRSPDSTGIDISAHVGDPISATADGVVVFAGWDDTGYGNLVILEHPDDWSSHYAKLDSVAVDAGQDVQQGELVGRAGSTGVATGPHLHFELRYDGSPVDPLLYLSPPQAAPEFALYLTPEGNVAACTGTPLLSLADIHAYDWATHAMTLTDTAYERIAQLEVSTAPGIPFAVCVGAEAIYLGEFWASYSSATFDGIVIDVLPATNKHPIRLQLGYPESPELFTGEDLRGDPRIHQSLDAAGKLIPQP